MKKDCILVIIEPDYSIFRSVICDIDISDILMDERVCLLFYENNRRETVQKISSYISWTNINTMIRTIHPGYERVYDEITKDYQKEMQKICENVEVHVNTMAEFSESAVYNVVQNLQYIKESNYINEFIGAFPEGYPAVVVSAGPSLQNNMNYLHELKDKAFVLVVDTAVKVMEENNIPYDAIVLIDPEKPSEFITKYPSCKDKPLFCPTVSQAEILKFHTGRKIWLPNSIWVEREYQKLGIEMASCSVGGSVATTATEIARIIGFKTIILVGQDLAYLGEQTHAGREEAMGEERGYQSRWVEGVSGEQVRTRWDWIHYLQWFEAFVKEHTDITLVDATEGGALIHGSKVMLEDAITEYTNKVFVFSEYMKQLPRTFEIYDFTSMEKSIKDLKKNMKWISEQCEAGLSMLEGVLNLEKECSLDEIDDVFRRCMIINKNIARMPGYELIEIGTSSILKDKLTDINVISKDEKEDKIKTAKMQKEFYLATVQVCNRIVNVIKEMKSK